VQGVLPLNWLSQHVHDRLELDDAADVAKDPDQLFAKQNALSLSPLPDQQAELNLNVPEIPDHLSVAVVLLSLSEEFQKYHRGEVISRVSILAAHPLDMLTQELSEALIEEKGDIVVTANRDLLHEGDDHFFQLRHVLQDHVLSEP